MRASLARDAEVVIASSGPFDLLPALLHRRRFGSVVATYVFHLIPPRHALTVSRRIQFALSRIGQRVALSMIRKADVVFVDNRNLREALRERGVAVDRIFIQRPAVNVDDVKRAVPNPRYQVVFIGRIVASKGVRDLILALRDLDVTAGIIGEGEERVTLTQMVRDMGMQGRVHLLGPLESGEMYGLLRGCELFVTPSYEEGYGIAIAEAITAGRPVLAYDLDHYDDVFAGSVMTVPCGDVSALSIYIRDFFARRIDRATVVARYANVRIAGPTEAAAEEMEALKRAVSVRQANRAGP
ncbi:MAG: glycosyltransferase [Verrucomicrobia bacterium]|nr:glycosyltransferase [Verrucomicrobiota bacterium]